MVKRCEVADMLVADGGYESVATPVDACLNNAISKALRDFNLGRIRVASFDIGKPQRGGFPRNKRR